MARLTLVLFMSFILFATFVSSSHARKLLTNQDHNQKVVPASLEDSLILSALPKGKVSPSAPSKKGHAMVDKEKLFARHLAQIDRILRSVPSPGIGN